MTEVTASVGGWMSTLRIGGIVTLACVLGLRRDAAAQRSDSTTFSHIAAGVALMSDPRLALYANTDAALGDPVAAALERLARSVKESAQDATHERLWPDFALGGGVVGALAVTGFALLKCDSNCQDDGSLGGLPPLIAVGAIAGAGIGAALGLIVDSSRSP